MGDAGDVGGEECQRARVYGTRCRKGELWVVSVRAERKMAAVNWHVRICGVTTD